MERILGRRVSDANTGSEGDLAWTTEFVSCFGASVMCWKLAFRNYIDWSCPC
jgi:hypothetical protein